MSNWYSPGKWLTVFDQRTNAPPPAPPAGRDCLLAEAIRREAYAAWLAAGGQGNSLLPFLQQARHRVLRKRIGLGPSERPETVEYRRSARK